LTILGRKAAGPRKTGVALRYNIPNSYVLHRTGKRPLQELDLREMVEGDALPDLFQTRDAFGIKPNRVDALALRQISGKFLQALSQLAFGTHTVSLLMMIEAHGEVNQALQKQTPLSALGPP